MLQCQSKVHSLLDDDEACWKDLALLCYPQETLQHVCCCSVYIHYTCEVKQSKEVTRNTFKSQTCHLMHDLYLLTVFIVYLECYTYSFQVRILRECLCFL